jgi:hypothetical protein
VDTSYLLAQPETVLVSTPLDVSFPTPPQIGVIFYYSAKMDEFSDAQNLLDRIRSLELKLVHSERERERA